MVGETPFNLGKSDLSDPNSSSLVGNPSKRDLKKRIDDLMKKRKAQAYKELLNG